MTTIDKVMMPGNADELAIRPRTHPDLLQRIGFGSGQWL
jgi:hypothetical protein